MNFSGPAIAGPFIYPHSSLMITRKTMSDSQAIELDAVIVGSGMAGLYMTKRLNDQA